MTSSSSSVVRPSSALEWNDKNITELTVVVGNIHDNTSAFTRSNPSGKDKRYFEIPLTFSANGVSSSVISVNDVVVPYVPPPPAASGRKSKYGKEFIYGSISPVVIDHILNAAALKGYSVQKGDIGLIQEADSVWCTLNIGKNCLIKTPTGHTLPLILAKTKAGVMANFGFTMKLKCSLQEGVDPETNELYGIDDHIIKPGDEDVWSLNITSSWGWVVDVNLDILPPKSSGLKPSKAPVTHVAPPPTDGDQLTDEVLKKLQSFNLN